MATDERGRKGGTSFPTRPDMHGKTARPTSVGPHHVRDHQEDPGNPGIKPEQGYAAEIARNNEVAAQQPSGVGKAPVLAPDPKTGTAGESGGTEDMLRKSGPARDAPPLRGTTGD